MHFKWFLVPEKCPKLENFFLPDSVFVKLPSVAEFFSQPCPKLVTEMFNMSPLFSTI